MKIANIGVVDIAIHDIGHRVAVDFATQGVGGVNHHCKVITPHAEQPNDLSFSKAFAGSCFSDDRIDIRRHRDAPAAGFHCGRRQASTWCPFVRTRQAARVGHSEQRCAPAGISPVVCITHVLRINSQALVQVLACRFGGETQLFKLWPWRFRIDEVGRQR